MSTQAKPPPTPTPPPPPPSPLRHRRLKSEQLASRQPLPQLHTIELWLNSDDGHKMLYDQFVLCYYHETSLYSLFPLPPGIYTLHSGTITYLALDASFTITSAFSHQDFDDEKGLQLSFVRSSPGYDRPKLPTTFVPSPSTKSSRPGDENDTTSHDLPDDDDVTGLSIFD